MFLREQEYWVELLNLAAGGGPEADPEVLLDELLPPERRDFPDPPGWGRRRTAVWLANWLDLLRGAFDAVEGGSVPDPAPLEELLADGELHLDAAGFGAPELRSRERALNAASLRVRDTVLRAAHYLVQYLAYRRADPAWPDASPERFAVRACLRADCGKLFVRAPGSALYCSGACAARDAAAGG